MKKFKILSFYLRKDTMSEKTTISRYCPFNENPPPPPRRKRARRMLSVFAESIIEKCRPRRICSSHFRGVAGFCTVKTTKYIHIYLDYHKCLSPRQKWDPPPLLPQASVSLPRNQVGEGYTRLCVRGRGSQFGQLEKKPSTLSTRW
jgi:hypothetical protein